MYSEARIANAKIVHVGFLSACDTNGPPSTTNTWPVIKLLSSLDRNKNRGATSSTFQGLPSGMYLSTNSFTKDDESISIDIGVWI